MSGHRGLRRNLADNLHRFQRLVAVVLGRKVIGVHRRVHRRIRCRDVNRAAAFRIDLELPQLDAGERINRNARRSASNVAGRGAVKRDLQFEIGLAERLVCLEHGVRNCRGRRHDALHRRQIPDQFQPATQFAVQQGIGGYALLDVVVHAGLQMVLQVLANTRQLVQNVDPKAAQQRRLADAGKLQQLWRDDRPRRQDHLATGGQGLQHAVVAHQNPGGTLAGKGDLFHRSLGQNGQVLAVLDRAQVAFGGRTALSVADRELQPARALGIGAVIVGVHVAAPLHASIKEALRNRVFQHDVSAGDRTAAPTQIGRRRLAVFEFFEIGQQVAVAPARIALVAPFVIARRLAPHINHPVQRR
ncbi:hypothetical protein GALL_396650 [mine drainage metagenome]|uniref:Uncharacterized protein n=1 Tax=mine drainage metagenome TaxID=410659 RepID=A0A1J5QM82_9ZZZZ